MMNFHDLYESYSKDVYRFAYWLAGDAVEAEDIASETFVQAWTHRAVIRTETLRAYLMMIARNIYLAQFRKRRRVADLEDSHPDPRPGPDGQYEYRSELEMVHQMLQTVPESDRAAFILRVQHELPYNEIGRVLQLSEVSVKVKVHRIRKKLQQARMSKEDR